MLSFDACRDYFGSSKQQVKYASRAKYKDPEQVSSLEDSKYEATIDAWPNGMTVTVFIVTFEDDHSKILSCWVYMLGQHPHAFVISLDSTTGCFALLNSL